MRRLTVMAATDGLCRPRQWGQGGTVMEEAEKYHENGNADRCLKESVSAVKGRNRI